MKTYTLPKTLVLDVAKWRCGGDGPNRLGEGATSLLNKEGRQCCLGQWCEQAGVPRETLLDTGVPYILARVGTAEVRGLAEWSQSLGYLATRLSGGCMNINDAHRTTPRQKIDELRTRLAEDGYTLELKNEHLLD